MVGLPMAVASARYSTRPRTTLSALALLLTSLSVAGAGVLIAPSEAQASPGDNASSNVAKQKNYRGTRAIVVDSQTGRARLPTQTEVTELVSDLAALANRSTEGLQQGNAAAGAIAVDLEGGFGGVMLARPTGNGGFETRCVFTFEEGAEFLGLVADDAAQ